MAAFHVALVPIGKVQGADVEAAALRAVRQLKQPLELRAALPVPRSANDAERGQYRAAVLLAQLRQEVVKLEPGKLLGAEAGAAVPFKPDGFIFVTDVDLFTAKTEGVLGALNRAEQCAVTSLRRIREAHYKRPADPNRQRARLVKELLRMWGRLYGLKDCADPECALAPTRGVPDLDTKEERFCRRCELLIQEGTQRI